VKITPDWRTALITAPAPTRGNRLLRFATRAGPGRVKMEPALALLSTAAADCVCVARRFRPVRGDRPGQEGRVGDNRRRARSRRSCRSPSLANLWRPRILPVLQTEPRLPARRRRRELYDSLTVCVPRGPDHSGRRGRRPLRAEMHARSCCRQRAKCTLFGPLTKAVGIVHPSPWSRRSFPSG